MRYHWIQDRIVQKHFHVKWQPSSQNRAEYFTKHHSGAHHQRMRPQYLAPPTTLTNLLQACKGVLTLPPCHQSTLNPVLWVKPKRRIGSRPAWPARMRYFSNKVLNSLRLLKTIPITLN
jgi:hypothetical protein